MSQKCGKRKRDNESKEESKSSFGAFVLFESDFNYAFLKSRSVCSVSLT